MKSGTILAELLLLRSSRCAFTHHAPVRIYQAGRATERSLHIARAGNALRKQQPSTGRVIGQLRRESAATGARPLTNRPDAAVETNVPSQADEIALRKAQQPAYDMTFTCRKCMDRSTHRVSKQAYHFGTTLITCPGCKNRHLISDHLKIFSDKGITLEDILKEKGEFLRKGRLGEDGDIEFYDEKTNEIGQATATSAPS